MTIFWNLQNEFIIITKSENLGFDIESRAMGKSYPLLEYPNH